MWENKDRIAVFSQKATISDKPAVASLGITLDGAANANIMESKKYLSQKRFVERFKKAGLYRGRSVVSKGRESLESPRSECRNYSPSADGLAS